MPKIWNLRKSRVLQHVAFWSFACMVLAHFFAEAYGAAWLRINLIYTGLFLWSIALVVYLNLSFFIPKFLRARKWLWYSVSIFLSIVMAIALHFLTFDYWSAWLFPAYYFISFYEVFDIFLFVFVFIAVTTLLKLAKGWFLAIEQQQQMQQLEKEKTQAELQALKAQINPHFLFNSLNSLYALSLDQDQRVSDLLLKLSTNMRYLLYETNEHFVSLQKEVEYLENYLDLQRLRSDQRIEINFELSGTISHQRVAPLIFLPFVENAFKHGIKGDTEAVFVRILLEVNARAILFEVHNNKGEASVLERKFGGIGLENVRKRLDLLYQEDYNLSIKEDGSIYQIRLEIPVR